MLVPKNIIAISCTCPNGVRDLQEEYAQSAWFSSGRMLTSELAWISGKALSGPLVWREPLAAACWKLLELLRSGLLPRYIKREKRAAW